MLCQLDRKLYQAVNKVMDTIKISAINNQVMRNLS